MDVTALAPPCAICYTNECQQELFDINFQHSVARDEAGLYQKALDVVVHNGTMPLAAMAIIYGNLFPTSQLGEGEDDDKEMKVALPISLLANKIKGNFIGRQ
jgi:hypothetical protein